MKTIEERANQYMIEERSSIIKSGYDISFYDIERAYKTGATDQQKIDIEKACEWLKSNGYIDAVYIDIFKQAMEEQI